MISVRYLKKIKKYLQAAEVKAISATYRSNNKVYSVYLFGGGGGSSYHNQDFPISKSEFCTIGQSLNAYGKTRSFLSSIGKQDWVR